MSNNDISTPGAVLGGQSPDHVKSAVIGPVGGFNSGDLSYLHLKGGNGMVTCTRCGKINMSGLGGWSQIDCHCMHCGGKPNAAG